MEDAVGEILSEGLAPPDLRPRGVVATIGVPTDEAESPLIERLTEREREVLRLVADGLSNQQIAEKLILSLGTVKWYTRQVYGKLGVQSRTQAIARARELKMLA